MSIQRDIADVIAEVGISFSIERLGVAIPNVKEYMTYTSNAQVTKPFVKEHFLEVAFISSTAVVPGDVVTLTSTSDSFLVMNSLPEFFEDEVIKYSGVLYKTNVVLNILRAQNTTVGYDTTFSFVEQHADVKALMYAPLFGNTDKIDEEVGTYSLDKNELYIPVGYGLKEMDRIHLTCTNENQQVDVIIPRRFPAINVCQLSEDTRE